MAEYDRCHRAFYPKTGNGRRPIRWRPCRIPACSIGTTLSDGAMEDALHEIAPCACLPDYPWIAPCRDRTTIMNFRHLLEQHQLARQLFQDHQSLAGRSRRHDDQGTLVDATIIEAPSSTKNKEQQRDPEMHQTRRGNQWHFGAKAHIGVDAKSGLTHSLVTTAANEHDLNQLGNLRFMERSNLSQPMPATRERHSARSWPRWMWTG